MSDGHHDAQQHQSAVDRALGDADMTFASIMLHMCADMQAVAADIAKLTGSDDEVAAAVSAMLAGARRRAINAEGPEERERLVDHVVAISVARDRRRARE